MLFQAAAHPRDSVPRIHLELRAGPDAPADARASLERLRGMLSPACLQLVELVLSELVTNAVRHSGARESGDHVAVEVDCGVSRVRIAVTDPGPGFDPADRGKPRGAAGGWGLYVVGEVADRWWVEQPGGATRVVAELSR
jgi:anti-sigma regulatory factor (Ser/Thr protein kinase)